MQVAEDAVFNSQSSRTEFDVNNFDESGLVNVSSD